MRCSFYTFYTFYSTAVLIIRSGLGRTDPKRVELVGLGIIRYGLHPVMDMRRPFVPMRDDCVRSWDI